MNLTNYTCLRMNLVNEDLSEPLLLLFPAKYTKCLREVTRLKGDPRRSACGLIFFGLLTVDAQLALCVCLDPEASSPLLRPASGVLALCRKSSGEAASAGA